MYIIFFAKDVMSFKEGFFSKLSCLLSSLNDSQQIRIHVSPIHTKKTNMRRYDGDFLDRYLNINNAANHNLRSNYPPPPPKKK